jgi:hypothetical protein
VAAWTALLVFALSVSSALFLVADLSQPFAGLMQISKEQLRPRLRLWTDHVVRGSDWIRSSSE